MAAIPPDIERKLLDDYNRKLDRLKKNSLKPWYDGSENLSSYYSPDNVRDILNTTAKAASALANQYYLNRRALSENVIGKDFGEYTPKTVNADYAYYKQAGGFGNQFADKAKTIRLGQDGIKIKDINPDGSIKGYLGEGNNPLTIQSFLYPLGDIRNDPQATIESLISNVAHYAAEENIKNDRFCERFARVPRGKTCAFCTMLAGRGYVYKSRDKAGRAHSACDCSIVTSWSADGGPDISGYNYDYYRLMYENARDSAGASGDGRSALQSITSQLRSLYPSNVDDSGYSEDSNVMSILSEWVGKTSRDVTAHAQYTGTDKQAHNEYVANLLQEQFGGIIVENKEVSITGVKNPDFTWNFMGQHEWESKTFSGGLNSLNRRLSDAAKQSPYMIFDVSKNGNQINDLVKGFIRYMNSEHKAKVIIIKNGIVVDILANTKNGTTNRQVA